MWSSTRESRSHHLRLEHAGCVNMSDINYLVRVRTMIVLFCASIATTTSILIAVNPFTNA
jgi:hypothetical protein